MTGGRRSPPAIAALIGDSLALLDVPDLRARSTPGARWADLGSGGGVPGIPLAVALPGVGVTLIESVARKCVFLEEAVAAAGLAGRARVAGGRSEALAAASAPDREAYGVVLAKAVGPLATVVELASPLLAPGGVLAASKGEEGLAGERVRGETAAAACGLTPRPPVPLARSPLDHSVCVVYEKTGPTPPGLPRRPGLAAKRPLGGAG